MRLLFWRKKCLACDRSAVRGGKYCEQHALWMELFGKMSRGALLPRRGAPND